MSTSIDPSPLATYQQALDRGELAYQVTEDGRAVFFPRVAAPVTGAALSWRISRGIGTVYATTVNHGRYEPARNIALIDLDEGFRMMSRVEDVPPMDVCIGLRVRLKVRAAEHGRPAMPVFVPLEGQVP